MGNISIRISACGGDCVVVIVPSQQIRGCHCCLHSRGNYGVYFVALNRRYCSKQSIVAANCVVVAWLHTVSSMIKVTNTCGMLVKVAVSSAVRLAQ